MLVTNIPCKIDSDDCITIAPCEFQKPTYILADENCEEVAFPWLLPTGKYSYEHCREIEVTPSRYFNQRLLDHNQLFANYHDYVLFVSSVLQEQSIQNSINFALKKSSLRTTHCRSFKFELQRRAKKVCYGL